LLFWNTVLLGLSLISLLNMPSSEARGGSMKDAARHLAIATWVFLFTLASTAPVEAKDDRARSLTRSIYLPVQFNLCGHLREAVLYQNDEAVSVLPARRIFQFTYYPQLERIEPSATAVRVEGTRTDGEAFTGRLAVTPWGVFSGNHRIELDMNEQLKKMRFKLDVRYQTVTIRLRCEDSCERSRGAVSTEEPLRER
jgi:hypothetical protein